METLKIQCKNIRNLVGFKGNNHNEGGFPSGLVGGALLAYAAYCTIQYRAVLKIREEEFSGPPAEVLLEVIIGLVLCFWAALIVPGKYLPILPDSKENRLVSLPENLDFMIFNHRGKVFPLELDLKLKS